MNHKLKKILAILISFSIFAGGLPTAFAADADNNCVANMKPFLEQKSAEMRTYMQEHFQSKKTNSSLLDLALKRFDVYKKDLYQKYNEYLPEDNFELFGTAAQKLKCSQMVTSEINLMEKQLRSYFEQTSNVKTTSAVMEKLKAINKKMDEMFKAVMQLYGKWLTLKGRVPCFIKNCV